MKTLEQILKKTAKAKNAGEFGINACKDAIKDDIARKRNFIGPYVKMSDMEILYVLLFTYVKSSNASPFFNSNMVQACWQLINER